MKRLEDGSGEPYDRPQGKRAEDRGLRIHAYWPVLRFAVGILPALVLVIFYGVVSLIALALDEGRRSYALAFGRGCVNLAAVLVGMLQADISAFLVPSRSPSPPRPRSGPPVARTSIPTSLTTHDD